MGRLEKDILRNTDIGGHSQMGRTWSFVRSTRSLPLLEEEVEDDDGPAPDPDPAASATSSTREKIGWKTRSGPLIRRLSSAVLIV